MAPIVSETDIARPPEEVFSYATDPARFGEWQSGVVSGHLQADGPQAVGSVCVMTRRMGGSEQTLTSTVTEFDPPRTWAVQGADGPIRADVRVQVDPAGGGASSHVTIRLDFQGQGMGKALLPLVVRQARKEVAVSCQNLKARLEAGAAG